MSLRTIRRVLEVFGLTPDGLLSGTVELPRSSVRLWLAGPDGPSHLSMMGRRSEREIGEWLADGRQQNSGELVKPKPPNAGKGRPKGVPNKTTTLLKDAILKAAEQAGGEAGLVGYLQWLAKEEPPSFSTLLGKVLPTQVTGKDGDPIETITRIEQTIVDPARRGAKGA